MWDSSKCHVSCAEEVSIIFTGTKVWLRKNTFCREKNVCVLFIIMIIRVIRPWASQLFEKIILSKWKFSILHSSCWFLQTACLIQTQKCAPVLYSGLTGLQLMITFIDSAVTNTLVIKLRKCQTIVKNTNQNSRKPKYIQSQRKAECLPHSAVTLCGFFFAVDSGSINACEKTSFVFLRQELPVRLSNIMKEINLLPDKLLTTPSVQMVQSW